MSDCLSQIETYGDDPVKIPGVVRLENHYASDLRGSFRKVYCGSQIKQIHSTLAMNECFISISKKNVFRGMHFQTPPFDCAKLITILQGDVIDVVYDLRKNSPTYLTYNAFRLAHPCCQSLFIPSGCAHGFLSMANDTMMLYNTTVEYYPAADKGIHYSSLKFPWPIAEEKMIISERDKNMPTIEKFENPFYYTEGEE